jgi:hypothetical protein
MLGHGLGNASRKAFSAMISRGVSCRLLFLLCDSLGKKSVDIFSMGDSAANDYFILSVYRDADPVLSYTCLPFAAKPSPG